ncbi:MAG: alpha/beta hydrolase, partial [Clostridia bacterium]
MDISKNFFEAIDLVLNLPQNTCPYIKNTKQIVSTKDIVYNMNYPFTCQMDTYFVPKKEGKYPVMLYIHGGGFVAGGKQYRIAMSQWMAENGIFVVCVDYGLAPEYIYPDPIKHLVSAVNWIADHAKEYNLDLDKLFVAGDSAGGYYSSMLCAVANNKTLQTVFDVSPKIDLKAAVLICGLYDIKKTFETKAAFNMDGKVFKSFTGIDVKDYATYELKDYISPIDFIDSSFPPTFMV